MRKTTLILLILGLGCIRAAEKRIEIPSPPVLHQQALAESCLSIKQGIPGESPFWNIHAHRFIYAPAFDFAAVEPARQYRFSIIPSNSQDTLRFFGLTPWEPLAPLWDKVPTGHVSLVVEAMDENRVIEKVGERDFYRASPYRGPYYPEKVNYHNSAERLFRYLFEAPYIQYWLEHGTADPEYGLYSYPSKMYSAVISGMLAFAELSQDPNEKETALKIARIVADKLIDLSEPEGTPLEYFPPTYLGPIYADMVDEWRGESLADRMMLIYPASAGNVYLDLFDETGESDYYEAAKNIAETYKNIQLENGTWYLLIYLEKGEPVAKNYVVPTGVIGFLNRMAAKCGCSEYTVVAEKAQLWIDQNLAEDFNWEGQFEDQQPSDRYKNLSKGQAVNHALHLLETAGEDTLMIRDAEELIRFAEDQFVIWENPVKGDYWGIKSEHWMTPCVLEQYNFYTPVNTSSASMIHAFRSAYDHTGNILYLAKAMDLANAIVHAQDPESGHYPTYLVSNLLDQEGWINCMVYTAQAILEFGDYMSQKIID